MTSFKILLLALFAIAIGAVSRPIGAQAPHRVRVALVDQLASPEIRAEVVRFGPVDEPPLILLRRGDERTDDLVAALAVLRDTPRSSARPAGVVSRIAVSGYSGGRDVPRAVRERAARMLSEVRAATPSRVGNLGRGRWAEFELAR